MQRASDTMFTVVGAGKVTASGVKVVGDTSAGNGVRLVAASTPCIAVRLMAPSSRHANGVNDAACVANVAAALTGNVAHAVVVAGGTFLDPANYEGELVRCENAQLIVLAGFVAGDEIHYQIYA